MLKTRNIFLIFVLILLTRSAISAENVSEFNLLGDNHIFTGTIHEEIVVSDNTTDKVLAISGTGKFYFRITGQTYALLYGRRVEVDIPVEMDVYNLPIFVEFRDIERKGPAPLGYESGDELVALLEQYAGTDREVGVSLTNVSLKFSNKGELVFVTGDHLGIIDPDTPE